MALLLPPRVSWVEAVLAICLLPERGDLLMAAELANRFDGGKTKRTGSQEGFPSVFKVFLFLIMANLI